MTEGDFPWRDAILALVAVQRVAELAWSRRNVGRLLARGGIEHGRGHYPLLVVVHVAWFLAMLTWVPRDAGIDVWMLGIYVVLQGLRIWTMASLGEYWTTRIVSVPDAPLVRGGPYRFLRHPNYIVVMGEIVVLPLVFGALWIAAAFAVLNGTVLAWRIAVEEAALKNRRPLV